MKKITDNVECKKIFENKSEDSDIKKIANLVNNTMNAWHELIDDCFCHSNKDCWDSYKWGERTTSGLFASAITKYIKNPGSVLLEFPMNKNKIESPGRADIEWITQNSENWIIFELKQKRVKIEDKTKYGVTKNDAELIEEIQDAFFNEKIGLIAQSVRDLGKYQGHKRISKKSCTNYNHVGLLFCPIKLSSITDKDINAIFKPLESKIPILVDRKDKDSRSKKNFGRFYSCAYLCKPRDKEKYGLITVAIIFRLAKSCKS